MGHVRKCSICNKPQDTTLFLFTTFRTLRMWEKAFCGQIKQKLNSLFHAKSYNWKTRHHSTLPPTVKPGGGGGGGSIMLWWCIQAKKTTRLLRIEGTMKQANGWWTKTSSAWLQTGVMVSATLNTKARQCWSVFGTSLLCHWAKGQTHTPTDNPWGDLRVPVHWCAPSNLCFCLWMCLSLWCCGYYIRLKSIMQLDTKKWRNLRSLTSFVQMCLVS